MTKLSWLTARPIAHRGYHDLNRSVYENTPSAFRRAIAAGFSIECDLQFAADGVPVVFHDVRLRRLCGISGRTRDRVSRELAELAIGRTADRIPTLAETLDLVGGRVPLLIELKGQPGDDDGFAEAVIAALEGYRGRAALMSFDHWLLADLKALDCPVPVGLTAQGWRAGAFAAHERAMGLGLDFLSYNVRHLPNAYIGGLRAQGVPILTWTVRTARARRRSDEFADQMTFEGFDPDA